MTTSTSIDLATWECPLRLVEMDFATKVDREIPAADLQASLAAGKFVWVDAQPANVEAGRTSLEGLGLLPQEVLERALTGDVTTQLARYEKCLHLAVTSCALEEGRLRLDRVDVMIGEGWIVTVHHARPAFLDEVRKAYRDDFQRHAKSPSFLLYELWDHLLESYHEVQKALEDQVEHLQGELVSAPTSEGDEVFKHVSELGSALLHFRKVLLPARTTLAELSTRRSHFVSEATQPYLANMVATVERILQDLLVDRDILAESLNLYMSIVGHRTNKVMNRLTVVSVIFLPLSFLCGVYGMNFDVLPELHWQHGYFAFWGLVATIVSASLIFLRKLKVL